MTARAQAPARAQVPTQRRLAWRRSSQAPAAAAASAAISAAPVDPAPGVAGPTSPPIATRASSPPISTSAVVAIAQIPQEHIESIEILLRADSAGASHDLLDWCRQARIGYSVLAMN